jgi:hypothetical protein
MLAEDFATNLREANFGKSDKLWKWRSLVGGF